MCLAYDIINDVVGQVMYIVFVSVETIHAQCDIFYSLLFTHRTF